MENFFIVFFHRELEPPVAREPAVAGRANARGLHRPSLAIDFRASSVDANTYLLPCGRQIIMDLALDTLPVETATVLETCWTWAIADMILACACS